MWWERKNFTFHFFFPSYIYEWPLFFKPSVYSWWVLCVKWNIVHIMSSHSIPQCIHCFRSCLQSEMPILLAHIILQKDLIQEMSSLGHCPSPDYLPFTSKNFQPIISVQYFSFYFLWNATWFTRTFTKSSLIWNTLLSFYFVGHIFMCYSQILCGGSAKIFRFWLFCIGLVANW